MDKRDVKKAIKTTKIALKHIKSKDWILKWVVDCISGELNECTTRQAFDKMLIRLGLVLNSICEKDAKKRTLLAIMENFREKLPDLQRNSVKRPSIVDYEYSLFQENNLDEANESLLPADGLKFWDDPYSIIKGRQNNTLH